MVKCKPSSNVRRHATVMRSGTTKIKEAFFFMFHFFCISSCWEFLDQLFNIAVTYLCNMTALKSYKSPQFRWKCNRSVAGFMKSPIWTTIIAHRYVFEYWTWKKLRSFCVFLFFRTSFCHRLADNWLFLSVCQTLQNIPFNVFCEITVTFDHQIVTGSSLNPSGLLADPLCSWYVSQERAREGGQTKNIMPLATDVAGLEA